MRESMEVALIVEESLHEDGLGFELGSAHLYAVREDEFGVTHELAWQDADIYGLLESPLSVQVAESSDFVAVVSGGWAAPITDNSDGVAPSESPERRRVRLLVLASRHGVASVLRFSDSPDEVISDEGKATGALNDAVRKLFFRAAAQSN